MARGLLIWDVDGTLVESAIDFPTLKLDLWRQVVAAGGVAPEGADILPLSRAVDAARALGRADGAAAGLADALWRQIEQAEVAGERAAARAGAMEALRRSRLAGLWSVALTNNTAARSGAQLAALGLGSLLEAVYGREDVPEMKPSPLAVAHVASLHPAPWTAVVGDSWIDAAAALGAGVGFVAVADLSSALTARGLPPVVEHAMEELPEAAMAAALRASHRSAGSR